MGKPKKDRFVVTRRLYPTKYQAELLDQQMDMCNRIYNKQMSYCMEQVKRLKEDSWYKHCMDRLHAERDENKAQEWLVEIGLLMQIYGISEFQIHAHLNVQRKESLHGAVGVNIAQKVGTALYRSVSKSVFSGTKMHYRKYGQTNSFEDKSASMGIVYHENGVKKTKKRPGVKGSTVRVCGTEIKIKPVRANDTYMMEALTHKLLYCRITRTPYKGGYHYFLQMVMEGRAPAKIKPGKGDMGIDEGTSTIATVGKGKADFVVLADGIEKYERRLKKAAAVLTRRLVMNNPDCINKDGTIKKGSRLKYTRGAIEALMRLKSAHAKKAAYMKNCHGYLTNRIVEQCDRIIKEPMDYKALAKRTKKPAERRDKPSTIHKKDGSTREVYKFKHKSRFGPSIGRRAPGSCSAMLEQKMLRYGGEVLEISLKQYKASQYDHTCNKYIKHQLSDRCFLLSDGTLVQRDLYSAFLLYCIRTTEDISRRKCRLRFQDFLKSQEAVIKKVAGHGDTTGNFGLKYLLAIRETLSIA